MVSQESREIPKFGADDFLGENSSRITDAFVVSSLGPWSYSDAIAVYTYQLRHSMTWVALAAAGLGGLFGALLLRAAASLTRLAAVIIKEMARYSVALLMFRLVSNQSGGPTAWRQLRRRSVRSV